MALSQPVLYDDSKPIPLRLVQQLGPETEPAALGPFPPQNEILYEKKKKRRRLRLRRLGKRAPPSSPQDGQPMDDWEKEMRQVRRWDDQQGVLVGGLAGSLTENDVSVGRSRLTL